MKLSLAGIAAVFALGTLTLGAPAAMAGNVHWSINIGTPGVVYTPPPVVYAPPPVIYAPPPAVHAHPRPVYVQPVPVVPYGRVYYERPRHRGHHRIHHPGRGHWKHHH